MRAGNLVIAGIILGAMVAPVAVAAPPDYPPDSYFQYGDASVPLYTAPGTNPNPSYSCGLYAGAVDAGTLLGTGGPIAQISFTTPFEYMYNFVKKDGEKIVGYNTLVALFGATAVLHFTSPGGGTIAFDFIKQAVTGNPPALPKTFEFTVNSSSYSDDYRLDFTIQFPNCPLEIEAIYR